MEIMFLPAAKQLGLRILWVQGDGDGDTICFFDHVNFNYYMPGTISVLLGTFDKF